MKGRLTMLLSILLISNSIAQLNLDDGLVAYYPFDGNANDASVNANRASTIDDPILINGRDML
ncbi:MAG: hypothetical protein AAF985_02305 [Bacteroidota bacterium]